MVGSTARRQVIFALAGLACLTWAGVATAKPVSFKVELTGAQQVPPLNTAGKGTANLTWNASTRVVTWNITYSGLTGPVTMAHFHNGAEGKNGPVVIWLTAKGKPVKGAIKGRAKLTAAQAHQFEAGGWYINVHTKANPAGEIRGQVTPPKS